MSRLSLPTLDDAPAESKPMLDAVQAALGQVPNIFRLTANSPDAFAAFGIFEGRLGKTLDTQTRERIALAVAQINGSVYCLSAHRHLAATVAGLSQAEITRNRSGRSSDARADAALQFAIRVTQERGHVSDAELEAVRKAGYTDGEIVEIVAQVIVNCFTNFLNAVAKTEIDYPFGHEIH